MTEPQYAISKTLLESTIKYVLKSKSEFSVENVLDLLGRLQTLPTLEDQIKADLEDAKPQ